MRALYAAVTSSVRSSRHSFVERPGYLLAGGLRSEARVHLERSGVQVRGVSAVRQRRRHAPLGKQARELVFHAVAEAVVAARRETVQHELLDTKLDVHTQPPISASVSGLSSLAHSV